MAKLRNLKDAAGKWLPPLTEMQSYRSEAYKSGKSVKGLYWDDWHEHINRVKKANHMRLDKPYS